MQNTYVYIQLATASNFEYKLLAFFNLFSKSVARFGASMLVVFNLREIGLICQIYARYDYFKHIIDLVHFLTVNFVAALCCIL